MASSASSNATGAAVPSAPASRRGDALPGRPRGFFRLRGHKAARAGVPGAPLAPPALLEVMLFPGFIPPNRLAHRKVAIAVQLARLTQVQIQRDPLDPHLPIVVEERLQGVPVLVQRD